MHEQSETVQQPDGSWVNIYGRGTPRAGQQLPGTPAYTSRAEAVVAARRRSLAAGLAEGASPETVETPPASEAAALAAALGEDPSQQFTESGMIAPPRRYQTSAEAQLFEPGPRERGFILPMDYDPATGQNSLAMPGIITEPVESWKRLVDTVTGSPAKLETETDYLRSALDRYQRGLDVANVAGVVSAGTLFPKTLPRTTLARELTGGPRRPPPINDNVQLSPEQQVRDEVRQLLSESPETKKWEATIYDAEADAKIFKRDWHIGGEGDTREILNENFEHVAVVKPLADGGFSLTVLGTPVAQRFKSYADAVKWVLGDDATVDRRPIGAPTEPYSPKVLERDPTGRPLRRESVPTEAATERLLSSITERAKTPWHSSLEREVKLAPLWRGTGQQWLNTLKNRRGVTDEELEWTGLRDFLKERGDRPGRGGGAEPLPLPPAGPELIQPPPQLPARAPIQVASETARKFLGQPVTRRDFLQKARAAGQAATVGNKLMLALPNPAPVVQKLALVENSLPTLAELEQLMPKDFAVLRGAGVEPAYPKEGATFKFTAKTIFEKPNKTPEEQFLAEDLHALISKRVAQAAKRIRNYYHSYGGPENQLDGLGRPPSDVPSLDTVRAPQLLAPAPKLLEQPVTRRSLFDRFRQAGAKEEPRQLEVPRQINDPFSETARKFLGQPVARRALFDRFRQPVVKEEQKQLAAPTQPFVGEIVDRRPKEAPVEPYSPKVLARDPTGRPLRREPAPTEAATGRLLTGITERAKTPWYSPLQRELKLAPLWRAPGQQWLNTLKNRPGVTDEELEWSGLRDFLSGGNRANQPLSRAEVTEALKPLEVGEVILGGGNKQVSLADMEATAPELFKTMRDAGYDVQLSDDGADLFFDRISQSPLQLVNPGQQLRDENIPVNWRDAMELSTDRSVPHDVVAAAQNIHTAFYDTGLGGGTRFAEYTLPGGTNYREVLLTLPARSKEPLTELPAGYNVKDLTGSLQNVPVDQPIFAVSNDDRGRYDFAGTREEAIKKALVEINEERINRDNYTAGHFTTPNVVAHLRTKDRQTVDGRDTLFIEEIQSDWHQAGRERGYNTPPLPLTKENLQKVLHEMTPGWSTPQLVDVIYSQWEKLKHWKRFQESLVNDLGMAPSEADRVTRAFEGGQIQTGVPNAPFKTAWPELALKRAIRLAVDEGKDSVSWTTGKQQIDRYPEIIHNYVGVKAQHQHDGSFFLVFKRAGNRSFTHDDIIVKAQELDEIAGKEVADKIRAQPRGGRESRYVSNFPDFHVGGEGMRAFYDQMLVNMANRLGKKYGARVEDLNPNLRTDIYFVKDGWLNGEVGEKAIPIGGGKVQKDGWYFLTENAEDGIGPFKSKDEALDKAPPSVAHSLPITPAMRRAVRQKGFPLFSTGALPPGAAGAVEEATDAN